MALANRLDRPTASCVRPPRPWNEPVSSVHNESDPLISTVSRAAGRSEFPGLPCPARRGKEGARCMYFKGPIKELGSRSSPPNCPLKSQNSKAFPTIWTPNANSQLDPLFHPNCQALPSATRHSWTPLHSLRCPIHSGPAPSGCSESEIFTAERYKLPHGELRALATLGCIQIVSRGYPILALGLSALPPLPNSSLRMSPKYILADFCAFPLSIGPLVLQMKLQQSMQGAPLFYKILPPSNASESSSSPVTPQSVAWSTICSHIYLSWVLLRTYSSLRPSPAYRRSGGLYYSALLQLGRISSWTGATSHIPY
jgi:hypothetical protein